MQPVDVLRRCADQLTAALGEQPQRDEVSVGPDPASVGWCAARRLRWSAVPGSFWLPWTWPNIRSRVDSFGPEEEARTSTDVFESTGA